MKANIIIVIKNMEVMEVIPEMSDEKINKIIMIELVEHKTQESKDPDNDIKFK